MSGYSTIGGGGNPFEKALELDEDMVKGDGVRIMTDGKAKKIYEVTTGVDKDSYKPVTTSGYAFYGSILRYQEFTTTSAYSLASVVLQMDIGVGTPSGNILIELFATDGSNEPTGSALATMNYNSSLVTSTKTDIEFVFDSPYSVSNATKYAIVITHATGDESNFLRLYLEETGSYAGGIAGSSSNGGSSWVPILGKDFYFITKESSTSALYIEDLAGFITEDGSAAETKTATLMGGILTDSAGTWNEEKDVYLADDGTITETVGAVDRFLGFRASTTETNLNRRVMGVEASKVSVLDTDDNFIADNVEEVLSEMSEFKNTNGIADITDSTIAFVDGTRVFTINRTGASFDYYIEGRKYVVATDDVAGVNNVTLTDTEGIWAIYYDGTTLTAANDPTEEEFEDYILTKCLIAIIYYDAANNVGLIFDERHGISMSPVTHLYLHETIGMAYESGLSLGDFVISDGDDNEDAQFSITAGVLWDEDLVTNTNAINKTTGNTIFYRDGSNWRWTTQTGFKCITSGGTSATRLAYDNSGTLTEVTDGKFVLVHIFGTNITDGNPVSIVGQAEYLTGSAARDGAETEMNDLVLGSLPSKEMKPIATIIYRTKDSYANDVNAKIVKTDAGDNYIDWRATSLSNGTAAGDHGSLGGLSDDDHVQYALLAGRTAQTLMGTRIRPRVLTFTTDATPDVDSDSYDAVTITAQDAAITDVNVTGTPTNFQKLIFRIKDDGTARAITWGSDFEAKGVALPTTTVISKVQTTGFIYDTVTSKWGCVATVDEL